MSHSKGAVRFKGGIVRKSFSWYPGIELEVRLTNYCAADVTSVVIGGRDVVSGGRHLLAGDVPAALEAALAALR